jgi:hypothetical protein
MENLEDGSHSFKEDEPNHSPALRLGSLYHNPDPFLPVIQVETVDPASPDATLPHEFHILSLLEERVKSQASPGGYCQRTRRVHAPWGFTFS